MEFSSTYYCPSCFGGGDLRVKYSYAYIQGKPYDYFCLKCKRTFKIETVNNL